MSLLAAAAAAVTAAVLALVAYLAHLGAFLTVEARKERLDALTVAHVVHSGQHHQVGPSFKTLKAACDAAGVRDEGGYGGLFYGVPGKHGPESLWSRPFVVLSPDSAEADLEALRRHLPEAELLTVPAQEVIAVRFPFKNMLSFMLSAMKAYPAIHRFVSAGECQGGDVPSGMLPGSIELYLNDVVVTAVPLRPAEPFVARARDSGKEE